MQQQFDGRALIERASEAAREIRKSDAYPALVGGIAGGIAGALMAAIIAGRVTSRSADSESSGAKASRGGWSVRDLVQLLTIAATLAKQVQVWLKEQEKTQQ